MSGSKQGDIRGQTSAGCDGSCPAEGLSFTVDYKKYFSLLLIIEENQFLESGV
jgi:hypothetical protein